MNSEDFKRRTKAFGIGVWGILSRVPQTSTAQIPGRQLLRASASIGANYRAACRARSVADFVAKMKIVEEECDESLYWMEFLVDAGIFKSESLEMLTREGNEILAMVVASIKSAKSKMN